ncbi:unnamed protein product [Phyllotreta striolata]|uniref:Sister chromatid cohesion protein DCC1 n=1 Tax=Phyllotreta striolata TaxID=444603 RepID=A0A9N9XSE2_PHYSR|nr:unnamed protein product [Phyllotreta striolata]
MEETKTRSLENIHEVLSLAKLNIEDMKQESQALFLSDNLYTQNYKLLELDPLLLNEISEGSTLHFKGEGNEEVVICSDSATFRVNRAENSNSMLLTNNLKFHNDLDDSKSAVSSVVIHGIFHDYLETSIGKPHLQKINDILKPSLYKGPEQEYEVNQESLLSSEELCSKIRASRKEISQALDSMPIIEIDNKIRLLDIDYHYRVLNYMLNLMEENSWEPDEVDFKETIDTLQDLVPKDILCKLFEKYTEESKEIDGTILYKYKDWEVCKFYAEFLLHQTDKFHLEEFLQAWHKSVPEGMVPDESMLNGIAIIDRKSTPNVIWAFKDSDLPENIDERFMILFETKEKWTVPEITPYIKPLATHKLDVNALLAKHARGSMENNVKYYSSKHGK